MPFRTTIAGSLPKPAWLAEPERIFPTWRLEGADLIDAQRDATRIAIGEQLRAGIDTVTDGEQARKHFVHGFAERLGGVDPAKRQKRGIRADRYEAVCPTVTGEIRRSAPIHLDEVRFARTLTAGQLKITIPGCTKPRPSKSTSAPRRSPRPQNHAGVTSAGPSSGRRSCAPARSPRRSTAITSNSWWPTERAPTASRRCCAARASPHAG